MVVFYGCFAIFCAIASFFRHQLHAALHFQSGLGFYLELGLSLIFFLGTLFARPTPPPVAEAVLARSRALQVLSIVSWFVLLAGSWMALTRASSMLLVSSLLSSYLAVGLVGTGWWVWLRMSPPDQVAPVEAAVAGIRAPLIATLGERALDLAVRVGLPLLMLILLVGLPLARNEYRLSLFGVSASAWLSFPAYLWAKRLASFLTRRELQWVAESGQLLEHSREGRRVRQLGVVESVKDQGEDGYLLTIAGEVFQLGAGELGLNLLRNTQKS